MARIIQSSVFAKGQIFYGCQYCKYWNDGCEEYVNSKAKSGEFHYDVIMKKLQQIRAGQGAVSPKTYAAAIQKIGQRFGAEPYKTMLRYGYRWGMLS